MAKCVAEYQIKRTINSVTISLTEDEVNTLLVVFAKVGGDPDKSPRGHIASINDSIIAALGASDDYYRTTRQYELLDTPMRGGVYFLEGK